MIFGDRLQIWVDGVRVLTFFYYSTEYILVGRLSEFIILTYLGFII